MPVAPDHAIQAGELRIHDAASLDPSIALGQRDFVSHPTLSVFAQPERGALSHFRVSAADQGEEMPNVLDPIGLRGVVHHVTSRL
jgi:hypothetical protein